MKYSIISLFLLIISIGVDLTAQTSTAGIPAEVAKAFANAGIPVMQKPSQSIDFSLPLADGNTVTLSSLKGNVVFLNFWATWCPPCREEMPSMEALYQRFKNRGLAILSVDIQENPRQVNGFMKKFGLTFPAALDASGSVSSKYRVRGIPATFILDRNGAVIISVVGGIDWSNPEMISAFEVLLQYDR
ncbi:MAG: TlpA family protein disulfide reductase [Treponema sp.]|nr:TlpA family protein disulfide reductase [Treponema sp.]